MAYIHFTAEGEVTFKSILFVPTSAPRGLFDEYGSKKSDYIKVSFLNVKTEFRIWKFNFQKVTFFPPA